MTQKFVSLIQQFCQLAKKDPERSLYTFVEEDGKARVLTCAQAFARAGQVAKGLKGRGFHPGDRVLLVYPPGLEFVESFLGCLLAGLVPVPVPPPMPLRPDLGLAGYTAMALDCEARAQLTCESYSRTRSFGRILQALKFGQKWPDLPWVVTDTISGQAISEEELPEPAPHELAFLQYTSGSTRAPRGACITFENIFAQTELLKRELGAAWDQHDTVVFWMPHYHDFALIGGVIAAACGVYEMVFCAPAAFLKRPAIWVEMLDRYRGTHTGSPDFGYQFLAQKTTREQRLGLDLSSVRVMMSAAEPIRAKTVDAFLSAFSDAKFNPSAFCPAYGLAEHTVAVSVHGQKRFFFERDSLGHIGEKAKRLSGPEVSSVELFGCGQPAHGVSVRIVHPETGVTLEDGCVGEIWVDSQNKAAGYFGRAEETKIKFEGQTAGSDQKWLRTGDVGLIAEKEIVVTGRLDDMIILRGRNIYPQDAESLITDAEPRVRKGRIVAFSTEQGEQPFVVVMELKEEHPPEGEIIEIAQTVRALLQQELGIPQATLVFSPHGTIPKTTSGKVQRKKCRSDWLAGRLPSIKVDRGL
jgi:acyl-CoA synthetase (AMP-forming)/AMP-acid ligase II